MAIEVSKLERVFIHKGTRLPDPDSSWSADQVLQFYSNQYPELTNANVGEFRIEDDKQIFDFKTTVGTKG
jgi:PRTRC genetic system protein C